MFHLFLDRILLLNYLLPVIHGGGESGSASGILDILNRFLEILSQNESGQGREGASWGPLDGIETLGSNIHPILVHFPIVFLITFFMLEITGIVLRHGILRQTATTLLYLGAFSAVSAVGAGIVAAGNVPHGVIVHEIMEWHERAGIMVTFLSVTMALWRALSGARFSSMAQALHLFLGGIMILCLFLGTDLGGLMVYKYGVGVKSLQSTQSITNHDHLHTIPK